MSGWQGNFSGGWFGNWLGGSGPGVSPLSVFAGTWEVGETETLSRNVFSKHPAAIDNFVVSLADKLGVNETLAQVTVSGLPVDSASSNPLTLTNIQVNTSTAVTDVEGVSTPAAQAVLLTAAKGVVGILYFLTVTVTTSAGRTLVATVRMFINAGIPNTLTTTTTTAAP